MPVAACSVRRVSYADVNDDNEADSRGSEVEISIQPSRRAVIRGIPIRSPVTPKSSANWRSGEDCPSDTLGIAIERLLMTK